MAVKIEFITKRPDDFSGALILGNPSSEAIPGWVPNPIREKLGKSKAADKITTPKGNSLTIFVSDETPEKSWLQLGADAAKAISDKTEAIVDTDANLESSRNILLGLLLGTYEFAQYKRAKNLTKKIMFVTQFSSKELKFAELQIKAAAVAKAKDLVNTPANHMYPELLATEAKNWAGKLGLKAEVWDTKRLAKERCGGILAVGQGSIREPRLVKISYRPSGATGKLALVGKGITFDTGGLSLKPAESMVGMKYDMTGAATVLAAISAIAELKLKVNVTAYMCLAENMPGPNSTRPNDVITARNGKTIEVLNTDAEGRLVLADGLVLASEEQPDLIVDVATLTGAATIALGNRYTGAMGSDEAIMQILDASAENEELVWGMPMPRELRELLDSEIADIANVKIGNRAGGMLIGAIFLKEFVGISKKTGEQIPWVHLDIAGTANNSGAAFGVTGKGATGVMIRTLISLAARISTNNR